MITKNNFFIFLIILLILFLVLILIIYYGKKYTRNKKGRLAEKLVEKNLRRYLFFHKGKLLNSVYLPLYDKLCEVDHILFLKSGIFVIETKGIDGTVSGNIGDRYLVHKIGSKTHSLYNPILQNTTHIDNIRHHLNKAGINNVKIHSIIIFISADINPSLTVNNEIIRLDELKAKLKKYKGKDTDYKLVYKIIKAKRVKNIFKKINHSKDINNKY